MNIHPVSPRQHVHQPGWLAALVTCLLLVALVLPGGAIGSAQAEPVAQEPPPSRLPYDGAFDLPQQPGAAPQGESAPALTAPEVVSWSKLVFQSLRNEHDWEIYSAQGDGSNQANISNHGSTDIHPRLNRGATRVVFASNRHGGYDLFTMNPDGGGQTQIVNSAGDDVYPAWSPDGSRIVFQAYRDGQAEIYVANADGSGQTRLTTHGDYDGQPAWSPDGSQIAFVRRESGSFGIWTMNANGSNQRPLSSQPYGENPAWSPDGSQIAYDADGNGDGWQEIWLMNADGSNQREVYNPPESQTDAWVGDWSPDGRFVAFTRISFVYYQGQWYWTAGYLDAWDSANPSSTNRLSGNGADWNPDWASTDGQAPASRVLPLPVQSPAQFTVYWTGSDTGGSGLKSYDIQIREGAAGTWTNWKTNTSDTSASYTGVGGRAYYFRARARDHAGNVEAWPAAHDAMTTVEANPPETAVLALPAFSRNGLMVQWGGSDPGGSGIQSFDVQYRQGSGAWTDWRMGVTETSASFSGTAGTEYRFRARARDRAQNLEAWPATADAATTLYSWAVTGGITDNRGAPVVGMATTTTPAAFHTAASDGDGAYAAHVSAVAASYSASWSKSGYGALPSTTFAPNPDAAIDVVLPPADNVVQNWGFESGTTAWQFGGSLTAAVTNTEKHTGAAAAFLGSPPGDSQSSAGDATMSQVVQVPVAALAPTLSFLHRFGTEFLSDSRLEVAIDDGASPTVVFSANSGGDTWEHHWVDLTPWAGRSVTLRFKVIEAAGGAHAWAYIDEITVGSAHPDIWVSLPGQLAAALDRTFDTIVTYGNRGGVTASNGRVTLQLPPQLSFVSADPPPTATTPTLRWDVGALAGQSGPQTIRVTLRVAADATGGDTLTTTASIASDTAELEQANNTATGAVYVGSVLYLPVLMR